MVNKALNQQQIDTLRNILAAVNDNGGWAWWEKELGQTRTIRSLINRGLVQERTAPSGGSQLNMTYDGMKVISRLDRLEDIPF